MRKQILLGFFLPVLVFAVGSVGAWYQKGGEHGGTQAPSAPSQAELDAETQRLHQPVLERLKYEDVRRVYHPMWVHYSSLDQFIQRTDGVVLGTVLGSEPVVIEDWSFGTIVCTDYVVLIEDNFGNAPSGFEMGQKVTIRDLGGRVKITGHFLEVTIPHWRPPQVGERAIIFVRKENDDEPYYVFPPGVFPIKDGELYLEGLAADLPFAVGKSSNEFMAEIRAMAPLLRTESRR